MAVDRLLEIALGNASFALALAIAVAVASRWVRRPGVLHLLWLLVLARLLTPPIFEVALLPARPSPASSGSFVTMSALAGAPPAAVSQVGAFFGLGLRGALLLGSLIGTAALVALAAARTLRLVRSVRTGAQPSADLLERVARVARLMAVRPPRVRLVAGQLPPMLWGVPSRAVLILPESLVPTLGQDELDAVIAHELAHLRRRDHWVRLLELAAVVLFWWNPVSWWASSRLRAAEEECCDALVAGRCPGFSGPYARGLLKTMGFLTGADTLFPAVVTGASHFRHIERRIRMIMTGGFARSLSAPLRVGLVIVVLSALVIAPTMAARAGASAKTPDADASTPVGAPITLKLDHAFLNDVLLSIGKIAGVDIVIDSRATMKVHSTRVSGDFVDTPWDEVLGALLRQADLSWSVKGNVVMVHLPGQPPESLGAGEPMDFRGRDADLRKVLQDLARIAGVQIEIDPDVNGKVSGDFTGVPWGVVFDSVVKANGFTWRLEDGIYHVSRAREEAEGTRPAEAPVDQPPSAEVVDGKSVYRYVHGGEITEPVRVQTPPPDYTPEARRARIQGVVVLDAVIDAEGRVASVKVLRGLPLGLTESAQEAVREWRFEPATLHGVPVAVEFILAVRFSLGEEAPSPTPSPDASAPQ